MTGLLQGSKKILEIETGSVSSHCLQHSLWRKLWTCRNTDYAIIIIIIKADIDALVVVVVVVVIVVVVVVMVVVLVVVVVVVVAAAVAAVLVSGVFSRNYYLKLKHRA